MKVIVFVPKNTDSVDKLEESVENTLEISLSDFIQIWNGEIDDNVNIDSIKGHLPEEFQQLVGTLIQLEKDFFFCATLTWLHVFSVD